MRLLGLRNAGTPLLIASTPVSAVQPDANARTIKINVKAPPSRVMCSTGCGAVSANTKVPLHASTAATANITNIKPINR